MARNFCIYCGTHLAPGEVCACRTGAAPVAPSVDEAYKVPVAEVYVPAPETGTPVAEVYAEPVPVAPRKFCIYCGTPITPGVECACRSSAKPPVVHEPVAEVYAEPAPYVAPAPEAYTPPAPVVAETKPAVVSFCTNCGRELAEGERCTCARIDDAMKVGSPMRATPPHEIPNPGVVSGGVKITMRTSDKPSKAPAAPNPYLNKPSDLD